MLNLFAVGLDCLAAKVKLLCYLARAVCSTQKLKHLHLAIGEALDLPPGTIASRISRCLRKMRSQLEGRKPRFEPSDGRGD